MKRRFVILVAVVVASFAGGTVGPAQAALLQPLGPAVAAKSCRSGDRHAIIGGEHKCLHTGQFCSRSYERQYRRYGFTCKPGSDGRYRLRKI